METQRGNLRFSMAIDKQIIVFGFAFAVMLALFLPLFVIFVAPAIAFGFYSYRMHKTELHDISSSFKTIEKFGSRQISI